MNYTTILVNLEAGRSNTHLLGVAKQVAERFNAVVIGSTACSPMQMIYGDGYSYGDILEQDNKEIGREIASAEAEFHAAFGNTPHYLDWRTDKPFNGYRQISTGDLIMQAGRPVLLVVPETVPFRMERFIIGWKNTREARRAVHDALPLLMKAAQVDAVEIAPEDDLDNAQRRLDDLTGWLGRHGVTARGHATVAGVNDADAFDAIVADRDADIVVAGAYGHSRAREWALGGVTRTLLRHPIRSSFVSH